VAKPGATIVAYDIVGLTPTTLSYPLPWATNASMDFVEPLDTYLEALSQSGLALASSIDGSELVFDAIARTAADPPPVHLANLMGSSWPTTFGNLVGALRHGTLAPVALTVLT
jgi:hypothetical protein